MLSPFECQIRARRTRNAARIIGENNQSVAAVYVYGSQATETIRPRSDIDLLVHVHVPRATLTDRRLELFETRLERILKGHEIPVGLRNGAVHIHAVSHEEYERRKGGSIFPFCPKILNERRLVWPQKV